MSERKEVSFGRVTVYEFSLAIGDSPSVREGVPVRLDKRVGSRSQRLDRFESYKESCRKSPQELLMTPEERTARLLGEGILRRDLKEARRRSEKHANKSGSLQQFKRCVARELIKSKRAANSYQLSQGQQSRRVQIAV